MLHYTRIVCPVSSPIVTNKTFNMYKYIQRDATVLSCLLFKKLYMNQTFTLPIIRSTLLHRQPLV
jgi:hypothetical protein